MKREERLEIGQLGEFGLIERIAKPFSLRRPSSLKGIGDDAAVIAAGEESLLFATDMLTEGTHFDLSYVPLHHLGYKAVVVNVSDIAAMNGRPTQIAVALALSNRFSVQAVDRLYKGIRAACDAYNVDLVGGDTTSSAAGLVLSVAVLGRAARHDVVYRKGANNHDVLCVSGDLGAAYLGLQALEREKEVFMTDPDMKPQLEKFSYMVGRQLKPEARTDLIYELADRRVTPTSMIDVSDGLSSELLHLSRQSGLGVKVFEDKIPIDKRVYDTAVLDFKIDPLICALHGGEDYELLFTVRPADVEKIKDHPDIHLIGHMHENADQNILISRQGSVTPLRAQGWTRPEKKPPSGDTAN